jgi:hypothetical protein
MGAQVDIPHLAIAVTVLAALAAGLVALIALAFWTRRRR